MFPDIGLTPDPVILVRKQVQNLFSADDADMIHDHFLPDGYNCDKHGLAVVIADDAGQEDGVAHVRDLVRVSVYGPDHMMVRKLGRNIYTALTQGITSVGLGVSRTQSTFFGSGPSYQPTGFVSTMSVSVGIGRFFAGP